MRRRITWSTGGGGGGGVSSSDNYLTITALEDGVVVRFNGQACEYSTNRSSWTTLQSGSAAPTINTGQSLYFRGACATLSTGGIGTFVVNRKFSLSGNCMSMLYVDSAKDASLYGTHAVFQRLFENCTTLITVSQGFLPATLLGTACYSYMFSGCSNLTSAPDLPAMQMTPSCYNSMFAYCFKLSATPALPAMSLASYCYYGMFMYNTSLKSTTALPAKNLTEGCYSAMFLGCSSITTAPALPALTLQPSCYANMFAGCIKLSGAPSLSATNLATSCYSAMFYGCASLKNAPELPATTLADHCYDAMFTGCTSLTTAPALPATTLTSGCYATMFSGCTSLQTAPALPATTLIPGCYAFMFAWCKSLINAPALPAQYLQDLCYRAMFLGCESLKNPANMSATTTAQQSCSLMYAGCTSLTSTGTLKSKHLSTACYSYMFMGCKSLTSFTDLSTISSLGFGSLMCMFGYTDVGPGPVSGTEMQAMYDKYGLSPWCIIPESLFNEYDFRGCYLSTAEMTSTITSLATAAFAWATDSSYLSWALNLFGISNGFINLPRVKITSPIALPQCARMPFCFLGTFANVDFGTTSSFDSSDWWTYYLNDKIISPSNTLAAGCYAGMFSGAKDVPYFMPSTGRNTESPAAPYCYALMYGTLRADVKIDSTNRKIYVYTAGYDEGDWTNNLRFGSSNIPCLFSLGAAEGCASYMFFNNLFKIDGSTWLDVTFDFPYTASGDGIHYPAKCCRYMYAVSPLPANGTMGGSNITPVTTFMSNLRDRVITDYVDFGMIIGNFANESAFEGLFMNREVGAIQCFGSPTKSSLGIFFDGGGTTINDKIVCMGENCFKNLFKFTAGNLNGATNTFNYSFSNGSLSCTINTSNITKSLLDYYVGNGARFTDGAMVDITPKNRLLVNGCYESMFENRSDVGVIYALFDSTPGVNYTKNWAKGVAPTGMAALTASATWNVRNEHGIPLGWTIERIEL